MIDTGVSGGVVVSALASHAADSGSNSVVDDKFLIGTSLIDLVPVKYIGVLILVGGVFHVGT